MLVRLSNKQKDLPIPIKAIKAIAKAVVALEIQKSQLKDYDEVAIHFVDCPAICKLHDAYFNDPSQTDCISFPIDNEEGSYRLLGDIFVCPQTAIEYATKRQKDPYQELVLYVIHGLLHLMGYDDMDPKDRRAMRAAERRHLEHLRESGLL